MQDQSINDLSATEIYTTFFFHLHHSTHFPKFEPLSENGARDGGILSRSCSSLKQCFFFKYSLVWSCLPIHSRIDGLVYG